MKSKTIKTVLSKVHKQLVDSIDDERVKGLVEANSIITGGSIVSMLLGEKVNDFDYYFTNKETVEAVAHYYVEKFIALNPDTAIEPRVVVDGDRVRIRVKSAGVAAESQSEEYQYFETVPDPTAATSYVDDAFDRPNQDDEEDDSKPKYRPIFLSDNAITLSNKVQLIIRFYGSPEEIHSNYDFVHATSWWRSKDGHLELPAAALEAILAKELVYRGSKYPLASVIRTRKFIQRGWRINAGQYLKMIMQLNELDLTSIKVLEDQLTGMDAAYFLEILAKLRQRMDDESDFKITSTYLVEIIDRLF